MLIGRRKHTAFASDVDIAQQIRREQRLRAHRRERQIICRCTSRFQSARARLRAFEKAPRLGCSIKSDMRRKAPENSERRWKHVRSVDSHLNAAAMDASSSRRSRTPPGCRGGNRASASPARRTRAPRRALGTSRRREERRTMTKRHSSFEFVSFLGRSFTTKICPTLVLTGTRGHKRCAHGRWNYCKRHRLSIGVSQITRSTLVWPVRLALFSRRANQSSLVAGALALLTQRLAARLRRVLEFCFQHCVCQ